MQTKTRTTGLTLLAEIAVLIGILFIFFLFGKKPLAKYEREYLQALESAVSNTLENDRDEASIVLLDAESEATCSYNMDRFRNDHLRELAQQYHANLTSLLTLLAADADAAGTGRSDDLAWHEALAERGALLQEFCRDFSILSDRPELTAAIADATAREEALALVESDLRAQLLGASPHRIGKSAAPYLNYRNKTDYTVDLVFLNLYQATDGSRLCDIQNAVLAPNERLQIQLDNMPADCAAWVTDWEIEGILSEARPLL